METTIGRVAAQLEHPQTEKFAWPIVLLPELFATHKHLALLSGYLATIGWTVYVPDLYAALVKTAAPRQPNFADALALLQELLRDLGRDAIVAGHGFGGLLALKLAETPGVRATVAFAPALPGFRTPLLSGLRNRFARWGRGTLTPPSGRILFELVADADAFQRTQLIDAMVPASGAIAGDLLRGEIQFAKGEGVAPRLIVAGRSDIFAPHDPLLTLATKLGARLITLGGRGHWIIGGRALERTIGETQRFLVRSLGEELLLLYDDRPPEEDDS
jgi:pimeloyl-ACP methyl ester carboxylesterase